MVDHIYDLSYIWYMKLDANTFFNALANEIRLRCLMLMQLEGELCVCELIHALNLSQPMISRHLALLRDSGLVSDRRAGKWVYYSINTDLAEWSKTVLDTMAWLIVKKHLIQKIFMPCMRCPIGREQLAALNFIFNFQIFLRS